MTRRGLSPCMHPGCTALARAARCDAHARAPKREHDARRGSSRERGYTARWQRARIGYLLAHPLCVRCAEAGQVTAASVVDHIVPHAEGGAFWDDDNWQALCSTCHNGAKQREDNVLRRRRGSRVA